MSSEKSGGSVKVRFFGPLEEIIGSPEADLELSYPQSEQSLRSLIVESFPGLGGQRFRLAVDRSMLPEGAIVGQGQEIACLPPFAGG